MLAPNEILIAHICLLFDIQVRVELEVPAHDVNVVRSDEERPGQVDVTRCEGDQDCDGEREPEESRVEEIVVVAVDGCREPSGRDDGVNALFRHVSVTNDTRQD